MTVVGAPPDVALDATPPAAPAERGSPLLRRLARLRWGVAAAIVLLPSC